MPRPNATGDDDHPEPLDLAGLDEEIAKLLGAIEREPIPDRLLKLAEELQEALARHRRQK